MDPPVRSALLDVLFPPVCTGCARVLPIGGAVTTALAPFFCADCEVEVDPLPPGGCGRCAEPGEFPRARCPRCALHPPPFERAFAPFAHQGAIARAVHLFKYEDRPDLAAALARLLAREAAGFLAAHPGVLCAIPLHRSRLRRRRYDQAELLSRELARLTGRERLEALTRIRPTVRQVGLSEAAREANLRGAFTAMDCVLGRDVLLVDDVFTTGATARAAAAALLVAGARSARVLTLARAFTV